MTVIKGAAECCTATRTGLGEGSRWDSRRDELLWVDVTGGVLFRERVSSDGTLEEVRRYTVGRPVGAATPVEGADGWLLAAGAGFAYLAEDGRLTELAQPASAGVRMNDAACDPQGRFWAGTMAYDQSEGAGSLYRLDGDGSVHITLDGLTISNGLGWNPDCSTMYLVDSGPRHLYAFDFDPFSGELSDRQVLVSFDETEGAPDGLTVDTDGCLWVAVYGGGCVRRYSPEGVLLEGVTVPAPQVTCCCFGPPDGTCLFVTTATEHYSADERRARPLAGGMFRVETAARGLAAHSFRPTNSLLFRLIGR